MTPEEFQRLVRMAELRAMIPTGTVAKVRAGETVPPASESFDLHIRLSTGVMRSPDGFIAVVTVGVQAQRKQSTRSFARFMYRVQAHYSIREAVSDEAIQAYVSTNGLVHVWPYARAWIQNASSSMGLPPVLLPFYRVQAPNAVPLKPDER